MNASRCGWLVLGAGYLGLVWQLVRTWIDQPETSDRVLILAAAIWSANLRRKQAVTGKPWPITGCLLILLGSLGFLSGWFVALEVGPRTLVLWWQILGLVLATKGWLLTQNGVPAAYHYRFAMLFPLLALPLPTIVQNAAQSHLQEWTTTLAASLFSMLGMAHTREGFVLHLPSGALGVVEACSGVRSVTALVAIAIFIAHVRAFSFLRGFVLIVLTIPVIVLVNATRVCLTGVIQESLNRDYITGWKHDALSFVMVLVGLTLILAMSRLLKPRGVTPPSPVPTSPEGSPTNRLALGLLLLAGVGGIALLALPRLPRSKNEPPPFTEIPMAFDEWTGRDLEIDPQIVESLMCDHVVNRMYTNKIGERIVFWGIHWSNKSDVRGYHHPDICMPNRGFQMLEKKTVEVATPEGRQIPVTYREFQRVIDRHALLYWTQEGARFWTEKDEQAALTGLSWTPVLVSLSRLQMDSRAKVEDRIVFLFGTELSGQSDRVRSQFLRTAGRIADELYNRCPWADPKQRPIR